MNLNMIRPKNETEDLLISITKNCETLFKQTHRKAEETLEFKFDQIKKKTFHFNPPLKVKEDWMIALIGLEVYNSIYNINTAINKFEFYTDTFDEFSLEDLKKELEEINTVSDITPYHLQHEKKDLVLFKLVGNQDSKNEALMVKLY